MARGIVLAAPASGSGKTSLTFGLLAALRANGVSVQGFKIGPDYIDPQYHSLAAQTPCPNLDTWAMRPETLARTLSATAADLAIIEGVMGLFDGAETGGGSTADFAKRFDLPVVLVVDAKGMSSSIAALVHGFQSFDPGVKIAGIILNRVGSARHVRLLSDALKPAGVPVLGALHRLDWLSWPSRHLGLTLPAELPNMQGLAERLGREIKATFDLEQLRQLASALPETTPHQSAFAKGFGRVAVAQDQAFSFSYPHWQLEGQATFFSPLNNSVIPPDCDSIFLPGGYPELYAEQLSQASAFWSSLREHHARGTRIYGECGGYMALGQALTVNGRRFDMGGLLPVVTHYNDGAPRTLGYRSVTAPEDFMLGSALKGHEFHASSAEVLSPPTLFEARDSRDQPLGLQGHQNGNTLGSYIHIIDRA